MFEHMKNYELLLRKLSKWLKDDGKLLVHIFAHRKFAYHFDKGGFLPKSRSFFDPPCQGQASITQIIVCLYMLITYLAPNFCTMFLIVL